MPAGRPTKYTEELLAIAREYPYNFKSKYDHQFPSIVGLCKEIKVRSETVYQWAKDPAKTEFSDIVKEIMDMQHFELTQGGITGRFNASISKLILAKHGHSDKSEVDQNIKAEVKQEISATESFASILADYKKD